MKKYKSIILIAATILVALLTSVLSYRWLKDSAIAMAGKRGEIVTAVVAAEDLNTGTIIKPDMVKTDQFLKGSLAAGFFTDQGKVAGRVVIASIKANEPIFDSRLAPSDVTQGGVAATIPQNMRAMSVKMDRVKGVSGFIHPGCRVDVVATFRTANSMLPITMTVLEDIPVLASGTETQMNGRQEKPVDVDVITLEVTPDQAEVLALASSEGSLQLSLRNYSDNKKDSGTNGVTVQSLVRLLSGKSPTPEKLERKTRHKNSASVSVSAPEPVRENYSKVQLIEGHKVNDVKFKEGSE